MCLPWVLIITAPEQFKSFNVSIVSPISSPLWDNWFFFNGMIGADITCRRSHRQLLPVPHPLGHPGSECLSHPVTLLTRDYRLLAVIPVARSVTHIPLPVFHSWFKPLGKLQKKTSNHTFIFHKQEFHRAGQGQRHTQRESWHHYQRFNNPICSLLTNLTIFKG